MFFGFQTPTSEFAQALVDFHHYVFFFLVVVTIFVVWMIKLSLLFVMREKNLLYRDVTHPSDFYIERNNKWFSHQGEFYYLLNSFYTKLWSILTSNLKGVLAFFFIFYVTYLPVIFLFFSKFFFFVNSFYTTLLMYIVDENVRYTYLRTGTVKQLNVDINNRSFFAKNIWVFQSSFWQKLYITDLNSFGDQWINFSAYLNKRTSGFFSSIKNMLPVSLNQKQNNIVNVISLIPAHIITNIRVGFSSIRFSHWTWSGKDKNVFLLFTGDGDGYGYPSNEFYAFDENTQLPQSLKFLSFYNKDLWSHSFLFFQNVRHRLVLEWVWTFIPTLILLILVIPSLYLLYSYDRPYVTAPYLTFKAIGHQWYWSYEYWDYTHANGGSVTFDSYMLHEDDLELGQLRLLEVDRRVVLPAGVCIRLLTTSTDVLHSWAVPAFGVKIDSIPGRLNQFWLVLNKPGVFYGQCSELCGVNHGFMPIAVEVVFLDQYLDFIGLNCEWFN